MEGILQGGTEARRFFGGIVLKRDLGWVVSGSSR